MSKPKFIKNKEVFLSENDAYNCELPYSNDLSVLTTPLKVGNKIIPNKLVYQAMEGCDGNSTGEPGELTIRRYRRFAEGGAGLIWMEATAVMQEARANPRQLYINRDTLDSFRRLLDLIREASMKKNGKVPVVILQLTHSGRYSKPEGKPAPLIAYNNPIFEKENPIPSDRILSDEQLDSVRDNLVEAAYLAQLAGFDGADIKCCHRYLLSETLSGYLRDGRYGGSFENRTRLFVDSVKGALQRCDSDFIVTSRMNAYDGFPYPYGFGVKEGGGTEPDYTEAKALVGRLRDLGVKIINITMGNPYVNPHVNRPYLTGGYDSGEHPLTGVSRMLHGIAEIQQSIPDVPVISSGISFLGEASPNVSAACINNGWFAAAGYGRMTLAYPELANEIEEKNGLDALKCCITCGKCSQIMRNGGTPGCVVRDKEVYQPIYNKFVKNA